MMDDLPRYLTTAPGGSILPSPCLREAVNGLPYDLLDTTAGELSSKETATQLWDLCLWPIIYYAVKEVD